jgi:ribosome-associated toxin RatA of RatAB toxin-antitoxin module
MKAKKNNRLVDRIVTAGAFCLVASTWPAAQEADTAWIDDDALQAGRILVDFGGEPRFTERIRAAAIIDAPQALVWTILSDCEAAPDYVDKVLSCELIETLSADQARIFRQRVKFSWFLPSFEHVFRLDLAPYDRIEVSRVSGPLDRLEGTWWLTAETETRTRVVYVLDFDPGLPLPRFIVGATLKQDVVSVLRTVRQRAESAP